MSDAPLSRHEDPGCGSGRPSIEGEKSYPNRLPIANSDDATQSPWSKKLLLSLDGGGVRGYSSLLILRRLLCIIADLESGKRNDLLDADEIQNWTTNHSSAEYPWRNPPKDANVVACGQDPEVSARCNAQTEVQPALSAVSSRGKHSRDGEAMRSFRSSPTPPSHRSGEGSNPSGTSPGETPTEERDSWKTDTLVRFRAHHYFDYVVGTSTGGLSTLMLSRMGMDIDDALRQYGTVGNGVFAHRRRQIKRWGGVMTPKYASANMNTALRTVVGHGAKKETDRRNLPDDEIRLTDSSELTSCRTAVIAYGGPNNTSENTYVFRNYNRPDFKTDKQRWLFNTGDASTAKVWEVARATSAAPLYFSKHTIDNGTYIDGGMGCNNPAEVMSQEVQAIHERGPELILSIGTGTKPPVQQSPTQRVKARKHKLLDNARNVFHIAKRLPDIVTQSEDCHLRLQGKISELRAARSHNPSNPSHYPLYFRFNVPDLGTIKLDAWRSKDSREGPNGMETLEDLELKTWTYLNDVEVRKNMEACAKELVLTRRERAKTERWEKFATHTTYRCPLEEEHECKKKFFSNREQLRSHAAERHEFVPWISVQGRPVSTTDECPEDSPICIMDQCAEAPQLFGGPDAIDQLLRHLQGPAHNIKDPKPYSKPALEAYLDRGRTTLDAAFQEEVRTVSREQPAPAQQQTDPQNAAPDRRHWKNLFRSPRRSPSRTSDTRSTGNAASNLAESPAERSDGRVSPGRQDGEVAARIDNNTTDSERQQGVGPAAEQGAGAESSSGRGGEATGRNDGDATPSQQNQLHRRQPQAPKPCVEHDAVAGPSNWQNGHPKGYHNGNATGTQQEQARRSSVEQVAGAERLPEHNGNAISPIEHERLASSTRLVSGRVLPSIDHAANNILHRRVKSA